jgi:hypothetical protein
MMPRPRVRRLSDAAAIALTAAALAIGPAVSAQAADAAASVPGTVEISTDGVHFGPAATAPLFASGPALVPGGTEGGTLYLRNGTPRDIVLTISVTDIAISDPLFAQALTLRATTPALGATPVVSLAEAGRCPILVEREPLQAGQTVHAALVLAMADVSGTIAQHASANFNLRVSMRDASEPVPASGCGAGTPIPAFGDPVAPASTTAGGPKHGLAATGVEARYPLVGGGLLFGLGATMVLFAALRRRPRGHRRGPQRGHQ